MKLLFSFSIGGSLAAIAVGLFMSASSAVAGGNSPPDNLSVSGTILSWRDNSAAESGFEVSIMPLNGQGAPVFTHVVRPNMTAFNLGSDQRACAGNIAVGVTALFADGTVQPGSSLLETNIERLRFA